jgi:PST family polysaccharide transporter
MKLLNKMLSFCLWTLLESISIWITANVSIFIVTRILGTEATGLYKTSRSTVDAVTGIISGATLSVLFSALSRFQNDDEAFFSVFYSYQKIVAIFVLPLGMGMWLYKDLLVKILLGSQWIECADFIGMYAFATVFSIVTNSFFSELYRSKGKPKISMLAQIIYLAFLIPAVILASKSGFNALCITITVAVYGFFVVHYCLAKRFFGIELRKLLGNIFSPLLASGAMAIFSLAVQAVSQNIVIRIISAALCVPVYLLAILLQPSLRSFLETNEFTADTYKKLKNKLWKNKLDQ